MAYKSGFFNSMDGDRKYSAEDMSNFYGQLISNGVLSKADGSLQVSAGSGLTVNVAKGWAWINSHWFYNDSTVTLEVPVDGTDSKTFSVVLRLYDGEHLERRKIVPEVIEGTEPFRDTFTYDIVLAQVYVPSNAVNVSNSNITDTRANTNLCGWVTGLITQVDTTTLFNQWQSCYRDYYNSFTSWFSRLTDTLGISTYLKKYEVDTVSTEGQSSLRPNVSAYSSSNGDILEVYVNGFRLTQGIDYTASGDGTNLRVSFTNSLSADNNIAVVVITSQLGVYPDDVQAVGGSGGTTNFGTQKNSYVNVSESVETYTGTYTTMEEE